MKIEPQAADQRAAEDLEAAEKHQADGDALAPIRRARGCLLQTAGLAPEVGAQQPAAVERKTGEEIEDGEGDVDERQVPEGGDPELADARRRRSRAESARTPRRGLGWSEDRPRRCETPLWGSSAHRRGGPYRRR